MFEEIFHYKNDDDGLYMATHFGIFFLIFDVYIARWSNLDHKEYYPTWDSGLNIRTRPRRKV